MAGLVPAIHAFLAQVKQNERINRLSTEPTNSAGR
jgi:hypothetical protein